MMEFCGLDVPIEGEELLRVVLNLCLTDELVTYQPELTWVGFHLGNLLCHGEGDLYLRESLIGGLDCLPESLCLGGPPDHLMGLGLVHPIVEAGLARCEGTKGVHLPFLLGSPLLLPSQFPFQ